MLQLATVSLSLTLSLSLSSDLSFNRLASEVPESWIVFSKTGESQIPRTQFRNWRVETLNCATLRVVLSHLHCLRRISLESNLCIHCSASTSGTFTNTTQPVIRGCSCTLDDSLEALSACPCCLRDSDCPTGIPCIPDTATCGDDGSGHGNVVRPPISGKGWRITVAVLVSVAALAGVSVLVVVLLRVYRRV